VNLFTLPNLPRRALFGLQLENDALAASRSFFLPSPMVRDFLPRETPLAPAPIERMLGEPDDAWRARERLIWHPAGVQARHALWDALRRANPSLFAQEKRRAMALGVWPMAQRDASWVAEAFLDGMHGNRQSETTCRALRARALAFEAAGFAWRDLAPRVAAEAAERMLIALEMGDIRWARSDETLARGEGASRIPEPDNVVDWAAVALRFVALPMGVHACEEALFFKKEPPSALSFEISDRLLEAFLRADKAFRKAQPRKTAKSAWSRESFQVASRMAVMIGREPSDPAAFEPVGVPTADEFHALAKAALERSELARVVKKAEKTKRARSQFAGAPSFSAAARRL